MTVSSGAEPPSLLEGAYCDYTAMNQYHDRVLIYPRLMSEAYYDK